ncbi:MAG: four helix bundle protein [Ardenticatenaceae bacterium]|nr:four helix bundle protein [Anaerolineales bacterium]MCB8922235.1 four helix bundle protein [Ardenticatenaceae bacterium]MCB8990580.1 four helix bundle protein [Ardenticatenaceae bacterium]
MASFRNYEEWLEQVPQNLKSDPLWVFETYRTALFFTDLAWFDCEKLIADSRGKAIANQLIRSAGSISANIEEGYGRGYGKDYARFLRIALGSARESRGWYFRGRHMLEESLLQHRLNLLDEIIKGLVIAAKQQSRK